MLIIHYYQRIDSDSKAIAASCPRQMTQICQTSSDMAADSLRTLLFNVLPEYLCSRFHCRFKTLSLLLSVMLTMRDTTAGRRTSAVKQVQHCLTAVSLGHARAS